MTTETPNFELLIDNTVVWTKETLTVIFVQNEEKEI